MLRISLVICTHNRAEILSRCLLAATRQALPPSEYEVIVVDNASTDHTHSIVERATASSAPALRYVYHPEKGLSHARNAGARAARAPLITYIDDDAIAEPDLLAKVTATFEAYLDAGCVGGRIDLELPVELPHWYSEFFDGYYSKFSLPYTQTTQVKDMWQYPFGANISFRVVALQAIGCFNTELGRIGRDTSGGEDLDACCRVARSGYAVYYNPNAAVTHVIFPSRLNWRHIDSSARAAGRNWVYYEIELLKQNWRIRQDMLDFFATCKQMLLAGLRGSRQQFYVAYSRHIFFRSKLARKLRYRFGRRGQSVTAAAA